MNMGSPNSICLAAMAEGGGDVRSTDDVQDNITWTEGRDITIMNVLDNNQTTELMKISS